VLYLLKVDALVAAVGFACAGMVIVTLFVWHEAKAYVAARHRIYKRLSSLITQPQRLANPLAISRTFSRPDSRAHFTLQKIQ